MNWKNIDIDYVRPIASIDISNDEELKESSNFENTQPILLKVHQQKGAIFNLPDCHLQFIKAYQFLRIKNGHKEDLHGIKTQ